VSLLRKCLVTTSKHFDPGEKSIAKLYFALGCTLSLITRRPEDDTAEDKIIESDFDNGIHRLLKISEIFKEYVLE